ncbi:MAG TPA: hypothetical protein VK612_10665, partial [Pyrinomonadaceae bacterium]|nr:hypothetical protein [Pyrinomonadaceae bacterium]
MGRKKAENGDNSESQAGVQTPVSLKHLSQHLGLSPTTISWVLNDSPSANSIPPATKKRIFKAAREMN